MTTEPITDEALAAIKAGLEGVPDGEWSYRPNELDDWGTVRLAPDSEGRRWHLAQCRAPYRTDDELARHREDGTDPWGGIAQHIARMSKPTVAAMIARIERAEAENARLREALTFYADPDNYKPRGGKVERDRGRTARDAMIATLGDDAMTLTPSGDRWTTIFSYKP